MIETRAAGRERPETIAGWMKTNAVDAQRERDAAGIALPPLATAGASLSLTAVAMPNGDPPSVILWGEDDRP